VPCVLAAGGKVNADFGASEAGAVVAVVLAPELAGVDVGVLKRPSLRAELPVFRPENIVFGLG
jgi:hypothetical protein